jgi:hypothetical protein
MSIVATDTIPLGMIRAATKGRPKGLKPYRPQSKTRITVDRILALYEEMEQADALPVGPRTTGYRLKEFYVGEYTKADFDHLGEKVKRLQQAGRLPWSWVADASAVTFEALGYRDPLTFLRDAADSYYRRDLRENQPVVIEVYCEARETLGMIRRVAAQRGVTVYSGGGSCGPNIAYKPAVRALRRAVEFGQSTLILGICDFDQAGIKNVMRPHLEHLAAFLYGTAGNEEVLAIDGRSIMETDASVSFRHLALTPDLALNIVEDLHDRDRIEDYMLSGHDVWSRDLDLLADVQKIETEALNPAEMRNLVVRELDAALDQDALAPIVAEEDAERTMLRAALTDRRWAGELRPRHGQRSTDTRPSWSTARPPR